MKIYLLNLIAISIIITTFTSCDRQECNNENPVFDTHSPESAVYKSELNKQLKAVNQNKLSYYLQKYVVIDKVEYMFFYVQGDGLCAILPMTAEDWGKLEKVRAKKGVSYRGAQFTKLTYDINETASDITFVYKSYDRLID